MDRLRLPRDLKVRCAFSTLALELDDLLWGDIENLRTGDPHDPRDPRSPHHSRSPIPPRPMDVAAAAASSDTPDTLDTSEVQDTTPDQLVRPSSRIAYDESLGSLALDGRPVCPDGTCRWCNGVTVIYPSDNHHATELVCVDCNACQICDDPRSISSFDGLCKNCYCEQCDQRNSLCGGHCPTLFEDVQCGWCDGSGCDGCDPHGGGRAPDGDGYDDDDDDFRPFGETDEPDDDDYYDRWDLDEREIRTPRFGSSDGDDEYRSSLLRSGLGLRCFGTCPCQADSLTKSAIRIPPDTSLTKSTVRIPPNDD